MICLTEQGLREQVALPGSSLLIDDHMYPYFTDPGADCFAFDITTDGHSLPFVARALGLAEVEEEANFGGAFLWYARWDIGSPQLDKIGWSVVEKMRLASGETRPLEAAPVHRFREDESTQLQAFILQAMVFQWDADVLFMKLDRFAHVSHHRSVVLVTETRGARDECWSALESLNPKAASDRVRSLFLRPHVSVGH